MSLETIFNKLRSMSGGRLTQSQVDAMNIILDNNKESTIMQMLGIVVKKEESVSNTSPPNNTLPELSWIAEAKKHLGHKEIGTTNTSPLIESWQKYLLNSNHIPDYLYKTPWCGCYIGNALKLNGISIPKHWYRALDYCNYGVKLSKPAYGCVAIKTRDGGGHVCFVVGRDVKTGKLVCLGGNQSSMVCYALYSDSDFKEFRWYGKTNSPNAGRYNLPKLSGITATKVTEQ